MLDAGSEKTKTDMVTSQGQLLESNNINRSLLVLGINLMPSSNRKRSFRKRKVRHQ
jgi:hypothetical protein